MTIYKNCMGMTADEMLQKGMRPDTTHIFSKDEAKLNDVAMRINTSTASPQDMQVLSREEIQDAIRRSRAKNALPWVLVVAVAIVLAVFCFCMFFAG